MSAPRRIQRSRAAGWRWPDGAIYVGRPTKWGNPFRADRPSDALNVIARTHGARDAAHAFRMWLANEAGMGRLEPEARAAILADIADLKGKPLMCWCPLGQPCHADVLLELANK